MCNYNKIIVVVGPTASGKSDLALKIAKEFSGEIVSCDSMQIYKKMDIGTAKPTAEEIKDIPHHMIDIAEINDIFSVSDYVEKAEFCVKDILSRNKVPVFCGGTGLYIDSFLNAIDFGKCENLPEYRLELENLSNEYGNEVLLNKLFEIDFETAKNLNVSDKKRIIRALEVFQSTGKTLSEFKRLSKLKEPKFSSLIIGLNFKDREKLYERINNRVTKMVEIGLIEETKNLLKEGLAESKTAGQAIGYKEIYPYINGENTLENCLEILKQNSRRYAKRQITWFSKNKSINWIYKDELDENELKENAFKLVFDFLQG